MALVKFLSSLVASEVEELRGKCNFTDDEREVFELLTRGKSIAEISMKLSVSTKTVERKITDIRSKVKRVKGGKFERRTEVED